MPLVPPIPKGKLPSVFQGRLSVSFDAGCTVIALLRVFRAEIGFGGEGGCGAVADRRGDLAKPLVFDVARPEYTGNIGGHVLSGKDVALVVKGDGILKPFVVRRLSEEDENPVHRQDSTLAGICTFEDGGGELAVREFRVYDSGCCEARYAGIAEQGALRAFRRGEAVHDFHHG